MWCAMLEPLEDVSLIFNPWVTSDTLDDHFFVELVSVKGQTRIKPIRLIPLVTSQTKPCLGSLW